MSQPSTWQLKCCIKFGWDEFAHQMEVDVRMYIRTMDQMAFGLWSLCCRLRRKKTEQLARNLPITHLSSLSLSLSLHVYIYIYIYAVYIYISLSLSIYLSLCVCVFSQQFGI